MSKIFKIEYYKSKDGEYPAEEFILSQNIKMQAKIFRNLELLESKGNNLREPYSKHLEDGIFELRNKIENGCANPSLKTIERIAEGMGKRVKLEFV